MKKLILMAAMLAMLALVAAPVLAQVSFEIGDSEVESGDVETETSVAVEGDNNNLCVGLMQFGNTGNAVNQQGALQYASEVDDLGFSAQSTEFGGENETECEQAVQQSAAASSWGW